MREMSEPNPRVDTETQHRARREITWRAGSAIAGDRSRSAPASGGVAVKNNRRENSMPQ